MAWGDPQDYWFNRNSVRQAQGASIASNIQHGMEIELQRQRQAMANAISQKNTELDSQRSALQLREYFDKRELQNKMMAGTTDLAGALKGINDWSEPSIMPNLLSMIEKHPELSASPVWTGAMKMHETAVEARKKREQLEAFRDEAGYVPPDPDTGAPGYFIDARGRITFEPKSRAGITGEPVWVKPNAEEGMPGYFKLPNGGVRIPPYKLSNGTTFQPEELTLPSGLRLYHASPNQWKEISKPMSYGQMTDIEKRKVSDIQSRRNAIIKGLKEPDTLLGQKAFEESTAVYKKKMAEADELSKELNELYSTIESRVTKQEVQPNVPKITTKEEYDKIPAGSSYIAPDGSIRVKK